MTHIIVNVLHFSDQKSEIIFTTHLDYTFFQMLKKNKEKTLCVIDLTIFFIAI